MRICHIISNMMAGGAESMLVKLVKALPDHDHIILSFLSGGAFAPEAQLHGATLIALDANRSAGAVLKLRQVANLLHELRPDVIQGWMYHGNLAASAAAGGRFPVVWSVRQTLARLSDNRFRTCAVILGTVPFARHCRAIVYNCKLAAVHHERWGYPSARRVVIMNGFDLTIFHPSDAARSKIRVELGLASTARLIGRIARNDPMKDNAMLIGGFARLAASNPDLHLVLVGRGMDASDRSLIELIGATRLTSRVHLLGERLDIPRITAALDVAVLTSRHSEGFPNVIGEAMACGVPVVATRVGAVPDIIDDPARVVPPANPEAFAAAVGHVLSLEDSQRRTLGLADRARIERFFSIRSIADQHADLWRRIAS
jgi:glycosyltransferase involved in cell wall biosynthesis